MRFCHRDGSTVHLGYCATVHPAAELDELIAGLDTCAGTVRSALGVPVLGVGLWFPHRLADRLANSPAALSKLRRALQRNRLEVVTLNGTPHAQFADKVVGAKLYCPDWTDPERLRYTLDLVDVLAELLPSDVAYGSVSTVPLGWRVPWSKARNQAAREAIDRVEQHLARTEARTGRRIRIAVETEPGCVLEMIGQAAAWLDRYSSPYGGTSRIGLGLDTCHLAVQFEDPAESFELLWRAGVDVVKAQLSLAPTLVDPGDASGRYVLGQLGTPKYLRQVREWGGPGVDDVAQAYELSGHAAWRMHAHLAAHAAPPDPLSATTGVLDDCLTRLVGGGHPLTHHLESEVYVWPRAARTQQALAKRIAKELTWLRDRLTALGLDEV
ncbi:xylose isomerase-like TIM barrel protein [Kribbella sp. VKM Ac-2569]|uniref:metabolite traffic protein EboE n=1 Tax=Kribbella sp. VKM Ac-2569 TaxID=2512220 RepID=UPI00102D0E4D|nr:metabolite traffic protein EboE [Kribbella sp. VKM Ac-2569]RZT27141.1 xylose isomerase-like TIM barrel protein [Kribbella sp. VKM Ac-2569]